jgi:hypothetical protein
MSLRNQNYRLGNGGKLFDMVNDPNQTKDVGMEKPIVLAEMQKVKKQWEKEVLTELPKKDKRPFYIGHPSLHTTQIPARDGTPSGAIKRSNRYPNCTYFTHWINANDSISWKTEVPKEGDFEVTVYYSCSEDAIGSVFELSFGESKIQGTIKEAHNPEEYGAEEDRVIRAESYVKDFKPLNIGTIHLQKGKGTLILQGVKKTGEMMMDFRLMLFKRL